MTDSDKMNWSGSWETIDKAVDKVLHPGVTKEVVTSLYNEWAKNGYDTMLADETTGYEALKRTQQAMKDLYPARNRDKVTVLDVGAGTGLSGQVLWNAGFRIIDGLDAAADMLEIAQEKNVYRRIYIRTLTGQPSDIPKDSYDCATLVGVVAHGGVPSAAFRELTRIVKPGGYIVNSMRKAFLTEVEDYDNNWESLKTKLEKEGRWKVVKIDTYPKHFMGKDGLMMIFQVLK